MVYFAVIDDNDLDSKRLISFIKESEVLANEKINIDSYVRGINFLEDRNKIYDAVFIDIDMPVINGLETSKKIRTFDKEVPIIFVTNYASFAINGYDVNAFGFLVKPVKRIEIEAILSKIKGLKKNAESDKKLILGKKNNLTSIPLKDIVYVEIRSHDITFHLTDGGVAECKGTLKSINAQIDSSTFVLCSSCYLVNLKHVDTVVKDTVSLSNGDKLSISRNKKQEFLSAFMESF